MLFRIEYLIVEIFIDVPQFVYLVEFTFNPNLIIEIAPEIVQVLC